jgi:hypothetical protein
VKKTRRPILPDSNIGFASSPGMLDDNYHMTIAYILNENSDPIRFNKEFDFDDTSERQ